MCVARCVHLPVACGYERGVYMDVCGICVYVVFVSVYCIQMRYVRGECVYLYVEPMGMWYVCVIRV